MKIFKSSFYVLLYLFILIILIAAISSIILKKPIIMNSIRSNSMYPVLKRGDIVFLQPVKNKNLKIGDIIVFDTKEGSYSNKGWILHRIVEGNTMDGYITKGDANQKDDQSIGGATPVMTEEIAGKVVCIGNSPLKISGAGYITLWFEKLRSTPYFLPVFIIITAIIIGFNEMSSKKKKKCKTMNFDTTLVYIFGGLTIAVVIGMSMLAISKKTTFTYDVSQSNEGVIYGSTLGIISLGNTIERPLASISNKAFFPTVNVITTNDPQITASHSVFYLKTGQKIDTNIKVQAKSVGKYKSDVWVGMFYPFLPKTFIYYLAEINFWLALSVVSLVPCLPLILYPLLNGKLRRKTIHELKRRNPIVRKIIKPFTLNT